MAKATKAGAKSKAYILTEDHLKKNPELVEQGYKVGDEYSPEDEPEEATSSKLTFEEWEVKPKTEDNISWTYSKVEKIKDVRITQRNADQLNTMSRTSKVRYYKPE